MRISFSKKFIFVHIPKTGGLSIKKNIAPYCYMPHKSFFNRLVSRLIKKVCLPNNSNLIEFVSLTEATHRPALEIRNRLSEVSVLRYLQEKKEQGSIDSVNIFDDFYKFAFVRNPWDLEVSMFHYLKQNPRHQKAKEHYIHKCQDFSQFIEYRYASYSSDPQLLSIRQSDLICDPKGQLLVDFVGKFENFQEDFRHVCKRLDILYNLPHNNSSKRRHYQKYYSEHLRDITYQLHKKDIEMFDYCFD